MSLFCYREEIGILKLYSVLFLDTEHAMIKSTVGAIKAPIMLPILSKNSMRRVVILQNDSWAGNGLSNQCWKTFWSINKPQVSKPQKSWKMTSLTTTLTRPHCFDKILKKLVFFFQKRPVHQNGIFFST